MINSSKKQFIHCGLFILLSSVLLSGCTVSADNDNITTETQESLTDSEELKNTEAGSTEDVPESEDKATVSSVSITETTDSAGDFADKETESSNTATEIVIGDKKFVSTDSEIDLSNIDLSQLDTPIEEILPQFSNLTKVTMLNCGLDNEGYAAICDANPDIKFVWEIIMSHWTVRTDQVAFGTFKTCDQTFFLHDDEAKYLKYCTDLVALDLGHNYVTDLSFLQYMPDLKVLILVDNVHHWEDEKIRHITDLSYVSCCPKLEYLEFFCNSVSDISFLASLPNLTDLNISYNPIPTEMAQYLYGMPKLQRLWMEHTRISYDEFTKLQASYPNVEMYYYGEGSIDHGWRTGSHYQAMRNMLKNNVIDPVYAD